MAGTSCRVDASRDAASSPASAGASKRAAPQGQRKYGTRAAARTRARPPVDRRGCCGLAPGGWIMARAPALQGPVGRLRPVTTALGRSDALPVPCAAPWGLHRAAFLHAGQAEVSRPDLGILDADNGCGPGLRDHPGQAHRRQEARVGWCLLPWWGASMTAGPVKAGPPHARPPNCGSACDSTMSPVNKAGGCAINSRPDAQHAAQLVGPQLRGATHGQPQPDRPGGPVCAEPG